MLLFNRMLSEISFTSKIGYFQNLDSMKMQENVRYYSYNIKIIIFLKIRRDYNLKVL